jgi:hypothetical protein
MEVIGGDQLLAACGRNGERVDQGLWFRLSRVVPVAQQQT